MHENIKIKEISLQGPQKQDALIRKEKCNFVGPYFQSQCYVQLILT